MKIISLYSPINFLAIVYPTSLANLVAEVGTSHSHQILLCKRIGNRQCLNGHNMDHLADFGPITTNLVSLWKLRGIIVP